MDLKIIRIVTEKLAYRNVASWARFPVALGRKDGY